MWRYSSSLEGHKAKIFAIFFERESMDEEETPEWAAEPAGAAVSRVPLVDECVRGLRCAARDVD